MGSISRVLAIGFSTGIMMIARGPTSMKHPRNSSSAKNSTMIA